MAFKKRRREGQFITPERLLKDNQNRLSDRKRFRRQEKRINYSFIPVDKSDGLLLVFRLNVSHQVFKETNKILAKYKLSQPLSAVFIRKTPEVMRDLILVKPFVAWGTPSATLIQELLTKHAFTIVRPSVAGDR